MTYDEMKITLTLDTPTTSLLPIQTSASTHPHAHPAHQPTPTSTPHHLYFAYGSNLSPTQMKARCGVDPSHSGKPLAIAALPSWRWLICQAGYANVLPPRDIRTGAQKSKAAERVPVSGSADAVFGVLYEMDPGDEELLDGFEGVDPCAEDADGVDVSTAIRPKEQGDGSYNKWYFSAPVVRWLGDEDHILWNRGRGCGNGKRGEVPVLVYVDEGRVVPSPPKKEYIARMNRGIWEAEELGLSAKWVEEVIRPYIPAGPI